jgi:hypothetical protein
VLRAACCPEDAVFSRIPNWVERGFIFLRGLRKDVSSDSIMVSVVRMFAKPAQELDRFANDVGRICADELSVSV